MIKIAVEGGIRRYVRPLVQRKLVSRLNKGSVQPYQAHGGHDDAYCCDQIGNFSGSKLRAAAVLLLGISVLRSAVRLLSHRGWVRIVCNDLAWWSGSGRSACGAIALIYVASALTAQWTHLRWCMNLDST